MPLTTDVQAGLPGEHDVGHGVDEDLGLIAAVLLVSDPEGVRDLVHQHPDARVRGLAGVDDDLHPLAVTPAAGGTVDRLILDAVAELAGEPLERSEEVSVALTGDRLSGR